MSNRDCGEAYRALDRKGQECLAVLTHDGSYRRESFWHEWERIKEYNLKYAVHLREGNQEKKNNWMCDCRFVDE